ncbi:hypothetical protein [Pyrodictium occultum]|uniref:hypothetical protein n=1 Tax=Pyrodictium occultum TaxID=2309 RepID=UPI0014430DE8|nr:hypothetical protein [Pyrodictium occultum]
MSRTWLITVVAVLIAAGLVAGYEVLSHPSTASKTVATTVARTTVATPAATLVKTVATSTRFIFSGAPTPLMEGSQV